MAKKENTEHNGKRIPQRVENAAKTMMDQASSGPRRGYIPPESSRAIDRNSSENTRTPLYTGQPSVTGSQRGFIMPAGQATKTTKQRKKHTGLTAFLVIFLIAALGTGGYFAGSAYLRNKEISEKVEPYNDLFCPGVYVDGISLGGMTPEQALNSVQSQIQQRHDAWTVQLTYNGEQVAEINADMLDFNVDPRGVLNEAWQQGHTG